MRRTTDKIDDLARRAFTDEPGASAAFGARLRMQLLLVFLVMAIAPSLLILLVGSDLIRQTVDRWFNVDVERILASSQTLGIALDNTALETSRVHARQLASEIFAAWGGGSHAPWLCVFTGWMPYAAHWRCTPPPSSTCCRATRT